QGSVAYVLHTQWLSPGKARDAAGKSRQLNEIWAFVLRCGSSRPVTTLAAIRVLKQSPRSKSAWPSAAFVSAAPTVQPPARAAMKAWAPADKHRTCTSKCGRATSAHSGFHGLMTLPGAERFASQRLTMGKRDASSATDGCSVSRKSGKSSGATA